VSPSNTALRREPNVYFSSSILSAPAFSCFTYSRDISFLSTRTGVPAILPVTIEKGKTSVTETVETNRKDDAYKQDTTTEDIVIIKTSNDDIVIKDENGEPNIKDKITIKDDVDPVDVKITAVQTTDKVIDIKNLQNNAVCLHIKQHLTIGPKIER
jgi:hypothetical protein